MDPVTIAIAAAAAIGILLIVVGLAGARRSINSGRAV
jgi:hypothetical protein